MVVSEKFSLHSLSSRCSLVPSCCRSRRYSMKRWSSSLLCSFQWLSRSRRIKANSFQSWGLFFFDCLAGRITERAISQIIHLHDSHRNQWRERLAAVFPGVYSGCVAFAERTEHSVTCPIVSCSFPRMKRTISTTTIIVNVSARSIFVKISLQRSTNTFEGSSSLYFQCSLDAEAMLGVDYTLGPSPMLCCCRTNPFLLLAQQLLVSMRERERERYGSGGDDEESIIGRR